MPRKRRSSPGGVLDWATDTRDGNPTVKPTTTDAYRLFHEGALALAEVERAGMRIDVKQLDKTIQEITEQIDRTTVEMKESEEWCLWKRRFAGKASLGSRPQLAIVLFDELGHESTRRTKLGKRSGGGIPIAPS